MAWRLTRGRRPASTAHPAAAAADCQADQSTTPAIYDAFVTWLAAQSANATVKTVQQVIGGSYTPPTYVPRRRTFPRRHRRRWA